MLIVYFFTLLPEYNTLNAFHLVLFSISSPNCKTPPESAYVLVLIGMSEYTHILCAGFKLPDKPIYVSRSHEDTLASLNRVNQRLSCKCLNNNMKDTNVDNDADKSGKKNLTASSLTSHSPLRHWIHFTFKQNKGCLNTSICADWANATKAMWLRGTTWKSCVCVCFLFREVGG